jgi:hypothetical protein
MGNQEGGEAQENVAKLSSLKLRWIVLIMSCIAMTGNYYS